VTAAPVLVPGDFEVVKISGAGGIAISVAQWFARGQYRDWDHARAYLGGGQWLQAEPSGAQIVPLGDHPTPGGLCSAGISRLSLTPAQQTRAWEVGQTLKDTPYSWLDYAALAAKHLHIPAPHLRDFITTSRHQMCSQLVDSFRLLIGSHLFADGRLPGDVTPWDLGHLLEDAGAQITP
jgi:hypothetical protein